MKTIAKTYFDANPALQEIHLVGTNGFSKLERAEQHAREIGAKVETVKREDMPADDGATGTAVEVLNSDVDLSTLDFNTLKKLVKELELTTADGKKDTLVAALIEKRLQLKLN